MLGLEATCFQIISKSGSAKSLCFEALSDAREGKNLESEDKIEKAKKLFIEAHLEHSKLIQQEATGESIQLTLLLLHAEDQLMSAETTRDLIIELIKTTKSINK